MHNQKRTDSGEMKRALLFILILGCLVWWPALVLLGIPHPLALFGELASLGAALMFTFGAMIASATAIGGGMVFNPTLQFVFSVAGYNALALAILVQCAGMGSGSYGWYRKGEYGRYDKRQLGVCIGVTLACTAIWSLLLILVMDRSRVVLPLVMKLAIAATSFYVCYSVLREQRRVRQKPTSLVSTADAAPLRLDGRFFYTIALGTLLNVFTAVGTGKLCVTDLINRLKVPTKAAVAMGTLLQAVGVFTQATFLLVFLAHLIPLELACIGMFFCMVGGRLAPYVLTRSWLEPHAKLLLALTALAMGLTAAFMAAEFLWRLGGV